MPLQYTLCDHWATACVASFGLSLLRLPCLVSFVASLLSWSGPSLFPCNEDEAVVVWLSRYDGIGLANKRRVKSFPRVKDHMLRSPPSSGYFDDFGPPALQFFCHNEAAIASIERIGIAATHCHSGRLVGRDGVQQDRAPTC